MSSGFINRFGGIGGDGVVTTADLAGLISRFGAISVVTAADLAATMSLDLECTNDVYDFDTGADKNKKESVVNLFGRMVYGMFFEAGQELIFLLGYYLYMVLLVFLGCRLRLELSIFGTVVASSILVGFTTSLILFCNHFHQIEDDKALGKFSPLARLGTEGGADVVKVLCALTLPVGRYVASFVQKNHRYYVRLHTLFGAALAAGLVAARMFPRKQLPHAILL
ncbi:hypothetical protein ACS0TY_008316 [Phlomoides rotata]